MHAGDFILGSPWIHHILRWNFAIDINSIVLVNFLEPESYPGSALNVCRCSFACSCESTTWATYTSSTSLSSPQFPAPNYCLDRESMYGVYRKIGVDKDPVYISSLDVVHICTWHFYHEKAKKHSCSNFLHGIDLSIWHWTLNWLVDTSFGNVMAACLLAQV